MLRKILLAVVVGVAVVLVCIFIGSMLETVQIAWVHSLSDFLKSYGGLIGLLAAVWYYFTGPPALPPA